MDISEVKPYLEKEIKDALMPLIEQGIYIKNARTQRIDLLNGEWLPGQTEIEVFYKGATFEIVI